MTGKVSGNFHAPAFSDALLRRLTAPARAELSALSAEDDAALYFEGLLSLAGREEQGGRPEIAAALYQEILAAETPGPAPWRDQARVRLDALEGRGGFGARAEVLFRDFARQSSDPAMLSAMFAAGTVFRLTRFATLARLSASPGANLLTRGLGARLTAGLAGFALEAPTFTLTHRLMGEALSRSQDWSGSALRRDLASSYLVLGGLKMMGGLSGAAYRRFGNANSALPLQGLFEQGGRLGGILLGHALEERAGLRPHQDGATTLVDSLALLLQFHVAGNLSRGLTGENISRWERDLDLRNEALSRPTFALPVAGPRLALAGAPNLEAILPNQMAMSSNEFDPKLSGPTVTPRGSRSGEAEPTASDRIEELRRVHVTRTWPSESLDYDVGIWSYELVLEDLERLLQPGADRVIARRNGEELRLKLVHADASSRPNFFSPGGLRSYGFEIHEGESRGTMTINLEPGNLHLYSIDNSDPVSGRPPLLPGAGTIILDWLATQAGARGERFHLVGIQSPQIFQILVRRGIFDPRFSLVEACRFQGESHRVVAMASLSDAVFRARHWGKGFFNVRGHPNPYRVPLALRSATVTRSFGSPTEGPVTGLHPYELQLDPLRNFLIPGHEAVIARREGRELKARVVSVRVTGRDERFLQPGGALIDLRLEEGGQTGRLQWMLEPDRVSSINLETESGPHHLPRGAGSIVLDWLATQAALQGGEFGLMNIKNPQIIRILARRPLLHPTGVRVEAGYWDLVYGTFQPEKSLEFQSDAMLNHFQQPFGLMPPLLQILGRPHLDLIPPDLIPGLKE